jgi:hypothetical protein
VFFLTLFLVIANSLVYLPPKIETRLPKPQAPAEAPDKKNPRSQSAAPRLITRAAAESAPQALAVEAYSNLPMSFEANHGHVYLTGTTSSTDWFITVYEDHQVIRTGPFRFIRHPAYGGALILFVSTLLFLHAWVGALLSLIFQLFAYVRRIRYEEAFMIDRPGDQYVEYTRSVNALVPKVW